MCCAVLGCVSDTNVPKSGTIFCHSVPVVGMSAKETGDGIWFICLLQTINHGCAST